MDPTATGHLPCLSGHQHPDWLPKKSHTATHDFINALCNGHGLDPAHLEKYNESCACAVCNATSPCLFNVNDDQAETKNVATLFPSVVNTLQELLAKATPYVDGTMDPTVLASHYIQIADPADHWRNYSGPCYLRRTELGYG